MPEDLIKRLPIKIEDYKLPFKDRLYLTPYLCLESPVYKNKAYFSKNTINFQRITEIFQIRDSYVHAKPTGRKMRITIRSNKMHHVDDSNPENYWPITKICKDVTLVNVNDIKIVKEATEWLFSCLNNFLENALDNKKWREEEKIEMKEGTLYTSHKID